MTFDPDAAIDYLHWVRERHNIWGARQDGALQKWWTDDPILSSVKFTNVYRVLDPGSQFVLTDLDCASELDTLARLVLYRYTNLPATWEYVKEHGGTRRYPLAADMGPDLVELINTKPGKKFSGAYMIIPQPGYAGDKVQMCVELVARLRDNGSLDRFLEAESQEARHAALKDNYGVGNFLAMQILTDWGYTRHCPADREGDFVVFGPGSKRGAAHLGVSTIHEAMELLHAQPDCPVLDGRKPSLMDCQNTLCEYSKYYRFLYQGKRSAGRPYSPAHPGTQPIPVLPRWW